MSAPLSRNCTVPAAFDGATVADSSTDVSVLASLGAVSVVVVWTSAAVTETVRGCDVEFAKVVVPVNTAVTLREPAAGKLSTSGPVHGHLDGAPMLVPLSRNWTEPVAVGGVTPAVSVTGVPATAVAGAVTVVDVTTGSTETARFDIGLKG